MSAHRFTNKLAGSSSPYLLQHAHNPVNWYPWGQDAIDAARQRNVPIFLSIGYSTCYWCHVMERESFESEQTASVMNDLFVNIKLDREQRPDLDEIYMAAVQMLTGSGGWPMSVFLDPVTLKPFWGGTYFPPVPAFGRPSFVQVLQRISSAYESQHQDIQTQAETVAAAVREKLGTPTPPVMVGAPQVTQAVETLLTIFDQVHGGFGGAPKFPQPAYIEFLLAVLPVLDENTRAAVDKAIHTTLEAMSIGGIYDHLGGGFHRYAVDATWTVPHFEKMLYDNAQLAAVYAAAASPAGPAAPHAPHAFLAPVAPGEQDEHGKHDQTQRAGYESTCRGIFQFTSGQMRDADTGLYYTALDAEVDGKEGLSYLWTDDSLRAALASQHTSPAQTNFAAKLFGTDKGPNFQDPHHPADAPQNVLRLAEPPRTLLPALSLSTESFDTQLQNIRAALLTVRSTRKQPRRDDKLLPSLNGMQLTALARAARLLGDNALLQDAERTAAAILTHLRTPTGHLVRSCREQITEGDGLLEDYAHIIAGLLALARSLSSHPHPDHRARATELISRAKGLMLIVESAFGDDVHGGYFDARADQPDLFVRPRQTYDGAVPSAQSVMLHNLIDLYELTVDELFLDRAVAALAGVSAAIADSPVAAIGSTRALLRLMQLLGADELAHRLTELGAPAKATTTQGAEAATKADGIVEVLVSTDTLELDGAEPAEMFIRLEIKPGYHINSAYAAEQSGGTVIPLRIGLTGGKLDPEGQPLSLRVYADYPTGEPMQTGPAEPAYTIHEGSVELRIVVEMVTPTDGTAPANLTGNERLTLQYQACRGDACLQPARLVLPVELRGV